MTGALSRHASAGSRPAAGMSSPQQYQPPVAQTPYHQEQPLLEGEEHPADGDGPTIQALPPIIDALPPMHLTPRRTDREATREPMNSEPPTIAKSGTSISNARARV